MGVFAKESSTFLKMLDDIGFDEKYKIYCISARKHKQEKYRDLRLQLLVPCEKFKVLTLEITTLGFVTKDI